MISGPASPLEWGLLGSGVATFLVFMLGLRGLEGPASAHQRSAAFVKETAVAGALIHAVGLLSRRTPAEAWAVAGITLYAAGMWMFLEGIDRARNGELLNPLRIKLALIAAWSAAPVATHSLTLTATAVLVTALQAGSLSRSR